MECNKVFSKNLVIKSLTGTSRLTQVPDSCLDVERFTTSSCTHLTKSSSLSTSKNALV